VTTVTNQCGPAISDAGLCGNEVLPTQQDRPNLYFVIDASGSMGESIDATLTKYSAAVAAIVGVLEIIGHRVSYGAAIFPFPGQDNCAPGGEVFKTQAGDSVRCAINGTMGDILTSFQGNLNPRRVPQGNTPLSATLTKLEPTLTALPGKTAVILATDGAPNCNLAATCTADYCEMNLAGGYTLANGTPCQAPVNCCDPLVKAYGQLNCVDEAATTSVLKELYDAGIPTYVIGLPGIGPMSGVLDDMAVAGGTARASVPRYYEVSDSLTLAATLRSIATQIALSCTIALESSPPNWSQVNVYLDTQEVPQSADNGWTQVDDHTLEITGTYCTTLQTGNVFQVQITAGCTTYVN
jgi:hypothetical protein